jgi:hypothetical protein
VKQGIVPNSLSELLEDYTGESPSPYKVPEGAPLRQSYLETKDTSGRNSYLVDDGDKQPLPLNYIVTLENTFSDNDSVNFIFEYLPGQDLYWVIQNQMNMKLAKHDKRLWVTFYAS